MSWAEPYFRVQTLGLLRGIMSGLRPRGLEKRGTAKPTKNGQGRLRGEGRAWKEFGRVEEGKGEHLSQLGTEARREGSLARRKSFQNNHDNHKS